MPITKETLILHELIGLKVVIKASTDPTLVGLAGIIRDETKNTLRIEAHGKVKTVPKAGTSFSIELPQGDTALIDGNQLNFRPEERIKKGLRHWR